METELIPLTDKTDDEWLALRHPFLGASELPTLLGEGYSDSTYYSLYRKKLMDPDTRDQEVSDRLWFGREMQPVFGKWLARRHKWDVVERRSLLVDRQSRLSCTQDFSATLPGNTRGRGTIETKNRDKFVWLDRYDGADDAWIYDKIQLAAQMRLTGDDWGAVCVLVGGNEMYVYQYSRTDLAEIMEGIPDVAREFWRRVDDLDEPTLEHIDIRDWAMDRGEVNIPAPPADIPDDLDEKLERFNTAKAHAKSYESTYKALQAEIIQAMGKHRHGVGNTHTVRLKATLIGEKEISFVRKPSWRHTFNVERRPGVGIPKQELGLTPLDAG